MSSALPIIADDTSLKEPDRTYRVIGIDLGTTNSTVAEITWKPSSGVTPTVRVIEVEQQTLEGTYTHILVPSIVACYQGAQFVGEGAKRLRTLSSEYNLREKKDIFSECKNDMGVKRTYHQAPEGLRSAAAVSGRILSFLKNDALGTATARPDRIVVTVPASFQTAQRHDTLRAAEFADLPVAGGDLLDEPLAGFLDYFMTNRDQVLARLKSGARLLVFDFGGGTCDVAIFRLNTSASKESDPTIEAQPLSVSRYQRLGGGDIDAAIVHQILIPQLIEQNSLEPFELGYDEKKKNLEPSLLGAAESLKTGLCIEIERLREFGRYDASTAASLSKIQPGVIRCTVAGRVLTLQSPRLTASEFEKILAPFLDRDCLYARNTEYHLTTSIFAPVQDALDRARLKADDVDICLFAGGSSLIPMVRDALKEFLPKSEMMVFKDRDLCQTAIARGAAWHALSLALYGHGLVRPTAHENIAIRTRDGLVDLVPKGAQLPYPDGRSFHECRDLVTPQSSLSEPYELRVELVGGDDQLALATGCWTVPKGINKEEPLLLKSRIDENQILHFQLTLAERPDAEAFTARIENPLTNVINPHETRRAAEVLEEDLRVAGLAGILTHDDAADSFGRLGEFYRELGEYERALDYLKRSLAAKGCPDSNTLLMMGIVAGKLRDHKKEEKFYRESAANSENGSALFNLALSKKNQGLLDEASAICKEAIDRERSGPYLALLAVIEETRGNKAISGELLNDAYSVFNPIRASSEWELGWRRKAAMMSDRKEEVQEINNELEKRSGNKSDLSESEGLLPGIRATLTRKDP